MKTTVSRRGHKGGKRLDANQFRDLLSKGNQVTCLGVVRQFPGESSHYELSTENGSLEVLVDVELIPSQTRVLCRLGFGNAGVYSIPRVDQEVAVICPYDPQSLIKDPMDFEPIIVGVLDVSAPSDLSDDQTIILKASNILAYDGSGAVPLALKSDVDDLRDYIANDLTLPVSGATAGPIAAPTPPSSTGTTVLKGK